MTWQVTWEVIRGARGRRPGDAGAQVWQGETVRFRVGVQETDLHGAIELASDERNWREPSTLTVTGSSGASVTVSHVRGDGLAFEYRFLWEGEKTLTFRGSARAARAAPTPTPTMRTGERRPALLFPDLRLEQAFHVRPEESARAAAAETTGRGNRDAQARERQVDEGRREATAERLEQSRALAADEKTRRERLGGEGYRDGRAGILPMDLVPDDRLATWEEWAVREYALDLRAAIRMTRPLDLSGNRWTWSSGHGSFPLRGATFRGRWTWRHRPGGAIGFHFQAVSMLGDGHLRVARGIDGDEAEAVRDQSEMVYDGDEWLLARFNGVPRKALFQASDLAMRSSVANLMAFLEAVGFIADVFDVLTLVASGGLSATLRGIVEAGRTLLRRGARVAAPALGAVERRMLAGEVTDAVPSTRGLGPGARGLGDGGGDVPGTGSGARGVGSAREGELVPYMTGGVRSRLLEMARSGLTNAQINVLERLLGRRLDRIASPVFANIWGQAVGQHTRQIAALQRRWESGLRSAELAHEARRIFGQVRREFFLRVAADPTARAYLEAGGMVLPGGGRSPRLLMSTFQGRREVTIDIDHISELGTHPFDAFSEGNLQFAFERQNRIFHNLFHTADPHLPDARRTQGRGTSRAGRTQGRGTSRAGRLRHALPGFDPEDPAGPSLTGDPPEGRR